MSEVVVKKYVVRLDAGERLRLEALIGKGKHSASAILKARILLKAIFPKPAKPGATVAS
jgi:hypothetical protein